MWVNSPIPCRKGRRHDDPANQPTENVLIVPPRLTKSGYQVLLACNAGIVPRNWHLEGRFGSRTHVIEPRVANGLPILCNQEKLTEIATDDEKLRELLETEAVRVVQKEFVCNHRAKQDIPYLDARVHSELEPLGYAPKSPIDATKNNAGGVSAVFPRPTDKAPLFTYGELFAGIGGFGVGLEALGGKCMFYSELEEKCRETYALNFDTPPNLVFGDIYNVPDEAVPSSLDILVAGFRK